MEVSCPLWAPQTSVRMSVKIKPFYIFSLSPWWSLPIASFWKYISDIERFHCLSVWNKEKGGVGGFIIRKSIELMKDSLPFNFISLTAALLLPFPEHKQIKGTRVIHLLCYQTVLVLGIAFRPTHTHTVWHTSFWHSFEEAVISHHHRGIYFWN